MINYFKINEVEKSGKIYEFLGVKIFRRIILKIGKKANKLNKRFGTYSLNVNNQKGLEDFKNKTMSYEKIHLIGMLIICFMLFTSKFYFNANLLLILILFIINFYAIILQRYNRTRIDKILNNKFNLKTELCK